LQFRLFTSYCNRHRKGNRLWLHSKNC